MNPLQKTYISLYIAICATITPASSAAFGQSIQKIIQKVHLHRSSVGNILNRTAEKRMDASITLLTASAASILAGCALDAVGEQDTTRLAKRCWDLGLVTHYGSLLYLLPRTIATVTLAEVGYHSWLQKKNKTDAE